MERQGAPIAQVQDQVLGLVQGEAFAAAHAGAAHHLKEAFALLWDGAPSDQRMSELGDHLRKALFDVTTDVVGPAGGSAEKPIQRLRTWLEASALPLREAELVGSLVDLAAAVLRLDHRLNHVRDEASKGEPPPTWAEARRAAFLTAVACYELANLPRS